MRTQRLPLAALSCALCMAAASSAYSANLSLKAGYFYGPGDQGIHPFNNAAVRNIEFTGPFTGVIPFFNNGAELPNVSAEILQGGTVDGFTSDGQAINENVDTGLHLDLNDPGSGETANIMVVATAAEEVKTDPAGNLVFETHVFADPGEASLVAPLTVTFTTGAAQIPLSLKTQQGHPGGVDRAGPFPSGYVLFGRIGDFDHDGFMDGELVLGENSPAELIAARGNPIAQRRPWVSDIPISPPLSAELNLANMVSNFPMPIVGAIAQGQALLAAEYAYDLTSRMNALLFDLSSIISSSEATSVQKSRARSALFAVRNAREHFDRGIDALTSPRTDHHPRRHGGDSQQDASRSFQRGLKHLGFALQTLATEFPLPSANMLTGAATTAAFDVE